MNPPTNSPLSRRDFLKLGGLGVMAAVLPQKTLRKFSGGQGIHFGRVIDASIQVYDAPSFSGKGLLTYQQDDVLPIFETVIGDPEPAYNQTWHRVGSTGYVHSTALQPVSILLNSPQEELPEGGALTDVTVPFTDAYSGPSRDEVVVYRFYYGSTHWVDEYVRDEEGYSWYRVADDRWVDRYYYVNAAHLHIIPDERLAPVSKDLPWDEKRIEVHLAEQMMIAYEGDKAVLVRQVSTGDLDTNGHWLTPLGRFQIYYKRPSRHMASPSPAWGDYDLPGVPWCCFFTEQGHAFHGAYWHNDFGRPRSHGCINLSPVDAKWVYLWTTPAVPPEHHKYFNTLYGTRLDIYS
ncbi:MAG: L,D-transpeptidase family protein [Anaerolineales bacterium]|jgi:hypothetical protein